MHESMHQVGFQVGVLTLADAHADGTKEQQVAATELLNHVQTRQRGEDVDAVGDDGDDEWLLEAGVLEVLSAIVD